MVIDEGSQLVKGCESMRVSVDGHNYSGKVERRIRHIREYRKPSILQWETVSSEIANAINDLPLAFGNIFSDYKNMDLLTPNRLKLGRNNETGPVSPISITGNLSGIMRTNKKIFNSWF